MAKYSFHVGFKRVLTNVGMTHRRILGENDYLFVGIQRAIYGISNLIYPCSRITYLSRKGEGNNRLELDEMSEQRMPSFIHFVRLGHTPSSLGALDPAPACSRHSKLVFCRRIPILLLRHRHGARPASPQEGRRYRR